MPIQYSTNRTISAEQFIQLLSETSLGARRPIDKPETIQGMLDNANLTVTAWEGERLVGVARSVTDFHFCCYVSDLAVSEHIQSKGVGRELIRQTLNALKPGCKLNLLAAPQAVDYYPKIGFTKHESAWIIGDFSELI
ncbi:protein export cytoplasm protein secA ATPase RNA helicase [Vibrio ishigakensis]|uniref:Protein export cytoplasm protein secA ATPase RNA helicase n=1 Tax=Vibrio ishigakensis TaxID=1481914 RepID=A0A0B8PMD0_9VIBR|nr:protein export cytoplasm protein secA ATPase RNA helicase [Vibrio ishigakensis]